MKKEPLLQVSKRRNKAGWQERLLIRFIALLLALIVCGAVIDDLFHDRVVPHQP